MNDIAILNTILHVGSETDQETETVLGYVGMYC